jgi:hypothetical protein
LAVPGRPAVVTAKPLGAQTTRVSDRSLDEFASATPGDAGNAGDEAEAESGTEAATGDEPPADPSRPTMRWSADGAACDACGTVVSRRWWDGEAPRAAGSRPTADADFVCADCKEW